MQNEIKELLSYDSSTGLFTWKKSTGRVSKGSFAGSLRKTDGYTNIRINGINYFAHRLAYIYEYGAIPDGFEIDHINHNKSDNRIANLRAVSRKDNSKNCSISKANTTGYTGVYYSSKDKCFYSMVGVDGKYKRLGSFKNIKEAAKARESANIIYMFHENHGK